MFIMLYACAGFTFWSESESCGKQFFEGKNMIGNIFEKKILLDIVEHSKCVASTVAKHDS